MLYFSEQSERFEICLSPITVRLNLQTEQQAEQFSKGLLLNRSVVLTFYKMYLVRKDKAVGTLQGPLGKPCQTKALLHFTTILKLSMEPG